MSKFNLKHYGQLLHHQAEAGTQLDQLSTTQQQQLAHALQTIDTLFGDKPHTPEPYRLRPHRPGDMGWVIHRHGVLYAEEYGWDETFEALVAKVAAEFIQNFDPKKEYCWIAERQGEIVGSIFMIKQSDEVVKLRLLYVESSARGLGLGARLVDECIQFAKRTGYKKITLWTNHVLLAARHIYEKIGFRRVKEEPHHSFGHDLIGETWELDI